MAVPGKRRAVFPWLAALSGGFILWTILAWPVPRFFASGISASPYTAEERQERTLILGDHIQLLYHFWLARDMISGQTPAFANIYEFNTDSTDSAAEVARVRKIDPYYAPFSWVYAAMSPVFGDATGWNAAVLLSVLLGAIGLFALARRHAASDGAAFLAAMAAAAFPYHWFTLHSGSPTGFAMGLAPFVPLGLDIAVRDRRLGGGVIAGVALFFAYCSDLHVFYFSAISAPLWCGFSWLCMPRDDTRFDFGRIALALLPAILLAAAAAGAGMLFNNNFSGTDMAGGRHWKEMQNFSPRVHELFHASAHGHIFLTFSLPALFLLCLACGIFHRKDSMERDRSPQIGQFRAIALLAMVIVAVVMLALGASGLHRGAPIHAARIVIPKYTMIRQPAKIFCLMPSLVAITLAMVIPRLKRHVAIHALSAAIVLLAVFETRSAMRPSISLLPREQPAYAAIAEDAAARGITPHALAIPLWPGDSHWSSRYLYGAMHSRVRLVNGYSPAKRDDYVENVFRFYESMNEGEVSDAQLDRLLESGVRYVVFHEDAFPEKVSPHPASTTLRRFVGNGRLEFFAHEGTAWAFRILEESRADASATAIWEPSVESISTVNRKARAMGRLPELEPAADGKFRFPAADLFHCGETVLETGSVRIDPERDPVSAVIYGPNRELPAGEYQVELVFSTETPVGTHLGNFTARASNGDMITEVPVVAGSRCIIDRLAIPAAPVRFEFNYNRAAALEVEIILACPLRR